MINKAVILAGGLGSRMMPLTEYVPKPMVRLNGTSLIDNVISFLTDNGIDDITVTYGHKSEMLLPYLSNKVKQFVNTTGEDNSYFLFNTFVRNIDEPIVVCPSDIIVDVDLKQVYNEYKALNSPPICIVPVVTDVDADCIATQNNVITSISRTNETNLQASGVQIINPAKVNQYSQPFDNFYDVWNYLIGQKLLYVTDTMVKSWSAYDRITDLK